MVDVFVFCSLKRLCFRCLCCLLLVGLNLDSAVFCVLVCLFRFGFVLVCFLAWMFGFVLCFGVGFVGVFGVVCVLGVLLSIYYG